MDDFEYVDRLFDFYFDYSRKIFREMIREMELEISDRINCSELEEESEIPVEVDKEFYKTEFPEIYNDLWRIRGKPDVYLISLRHLPRGPNYQVLGLYDIRNHRIYVGKELSRDKKKWVRAHEAGHSKGLFNERHADKYADYSISS